jgi:dihydroflavonol-4-reductase
MRAFVTGATGVVGANLVALLNREQVEARILRRPTSSLVALEGLAYDPVVGDILDPPERLAEAMAGCEIVFHVAAVSDYWRQPRSRIYEVNVEGTRRVIQGARLAGAGRLIFTSSLAAMGVPEAGEQLDERHRFNLPPERFPYGHSKWLAEELVREAVYEGLEAVIVNPTIVIGPRDVYQIGGSLIVEAARGRAFFYPPGSVNYIAAADVAFGHLQAARLGRVGERYILAGENLSYRDAFRTICEVVGRPMPRLALPSWAIEAVAAAASAARRGLGTRIPVDANQIRLSALPLLADGRKAREEFNMPETPFRTAVQQAYDWYNSHGLIHS